jgi:outer membrane protein assembly factor BamB/tRNA A-37 threonylcarbamoyl transferase component Bud32
LHKSLSQTIIAIIDTQPEKAMPSLTTRQLPGKTARQAVAKGQLPPGAILQDRYQIVGVLGVGGMGSVYQARDLRFPNVTKLCAVKEMMNLANDPQVRKLTIQNFEREANILATLDHPAIPEIFDYFSEDNRSFLVMEFISGKSLEDLMEESESFLDEANVLQWAVQICNVLAYLHLHKPDPIVFRDLKPSNVMLDLHGNIRMVDFGIAKVFQTGERGTMIGTEGYSPPEQYRGEAGPASDIYALGATLHALLTKQDPRLEPPFSFVDRPIRGVNPDVTPAFEAVVMKALSYAVEDRFADAAEMLDALEALGNQSFSHRASGGRVESAGRTGHLKTAYQIAPDNVVPLWSFKCEDEIRSTPCLAEDRIFVGSYDNNLYAIDLDSGSFVWKYATKGGIASSPTVYEGRVFFGSQDAKLYSVYAETGQLVWSFRTEGAIYGSPRGQFGHIFVGSDDHHFYAINAQSGRPAWKIDTGARVRSSACIGDELVYFGSEDGVVHALAMDGNAKWRFLAKRAVTSSPALAEGLLIVGSQDWSIYAIDANTGWSAWRFRTRKPVISSPAIRDNMIYVGSADGSLYAIDLSTGQLVWSYETDGQVTSSPVVHNDAVYFGGIDGYVYSIDAYKGTLRWRFQSGGPVPSSPMAFEDLILIGSTDGRVYALPA